MTCIVIIKHVVEAIAVLQPDERGSVATEIVFETRTDQQGHAQLSRIVARVLILQ
ncbi:MAG: hypothetical protein IPI55_04370 [Flavobacteriales bacterium]|nr:hypothetical protein [Flavobacteriales bacterium]